MANKKLVITMEQPTLALAIKGGAPVANLVKDFTMSGDGVNLLQTMPGRWEGLLGNTGRATLHVGGTLYFSANGNHGVAGADISVLFASPGHTRALLSVTVITALPMEISCESNLRFGTVLLSNTHGVGKISVAERAQASAIALGSGISVVGGSHPAVCTVTNVSASGGARVMLSGPADEPGSYLGTILSAVALKNPNKSRLDLSLVASTDSIGSNGNSAAGTQVFIGGSVLIPNKVDLGTYSQTFTMMVIE